MTIFRSSSEDVEFDSVQQFHELSGKTLPEQNHFVPVTADGADSAHELAERRFHDAVNMAFEKLESATTGLKKAAEDCEKAETERAKSRAERALESRAREKYQAELDLDEREADAIRLTGLFLKPRKSEEEAIAAEERFTAERKAEYVTDARREAAAAEAEGIARASRQVENAGMEDAQRKADEEKKGKGGNQNGCGANSAKKRAGRGEEGRGEGAGEQGLLPAGDVEGAARAEVDKRAKEQRLRRLSLEAEAKIDRDSKADRERRARRRLKRRAKEYEARARRNAGKGSKDIQVGTRLHDGWCNTVNPGYGTVMGVNWDSSGQVTVSYEVFSRASGKLQTMFPRAVRKDAAHAQCVAESGGDSNEDSGSDEHNTECTERGRSRWLRGGVRADSDGEDGISDGGGGSHDDSTEMSDDDRSRQLRDSECSESDGEGGRLDDDGGSHDDSMDISDDDRPRRRRDSELSESDGEGGGFDDGGGSQDDSIEMIEGDCSPWRRDSERVDSDAENGSSAEDGGSHDDNSDVTEQDRSRRRRGDEHSAGDRDAGSSEQDCTSRDHCTHLPEEVRSRRRRECERSADDGAGGNMDEDECCHDDSMEVREEGVSRRRRRRRQRGDERSAGYGAYGSSELYGHSHHHSSDWGENDRDGSEEFSEADDQCSTTTSQYVDGCMDGQKGGFPGYTADTGGEENNRSNAGAAPVARIGRSFTVTGSPDDTWGSVFAELLRDFRKAGHDTLLVRRVRKTADGSRYTYCKIECKHSGQPRIKDQMKPGGYRRAVNPSIKVGCPFLVSISWALRDDAPHVTVSRENHNHDPRGSITRADPHILPTSIVATRERDIRKWTAAGLRAGDIIKFLEADGEGLLLGKDGKKKVRNMMQKVQKDFYCSPQDATEFFSTLKSEPGMLCEYTLAAEGRLVDAYWATAEQQEKLSSRRIDTGRTFAVNGLEKMFRPIRDSLRAAGASNYCEKELRVEFSNGCQAYDVSIVRGPTDADGRPLPVSAAYVRRLPSVNPRAKILQEVPDLTDLESDFHGGSDASMWARTSLQAFLNLIADVPAEAVAIVQYKLTTRASRPSHLVVLGPGNFHLCSCLQLLHRGLPCRHYFAIFPQILEKMVDAGGEVQHRFDSACVHNRWRERTDGQDAPWSVNQVLRSSGHGEGWDGVRDSGSDGGRGPTVGNNADGVHPPEPAESKRNARVEADQRRIFATMMARFKEETNTIISSVSSPAEALLIQTQMVAYGSTLIHMAKGAPGPGNPAKPPQKGRRKGSGNKSKFSTHEVGRGKVKGSVNVEEKASNPQQRGGNSKRTKCHRDSMETRGSRPRKRSKTSVP